MKMDKIREFTESIESLLENYEYKAALEKIGAEGIRIVEKYKGEKSLKRLLLLICKVYNHSDKIPHVLKYCSIIDRLYPDVQCSSEYLDIRMQLHIKQNSIREFIDFLCKTIEKKKDNKAINIIYYYLGSAYFWIGDYISSYEYLRKCHSYFEHTKNHLFCGKIFYLYGYIEFQRGFLELSESYYYKALQEFKNAEANYQIGITLHMLGILFYRKAEFSRSKKYLTKARTVFSKHNHKIAFIESSTAFGQVLMLEKKFDRAKSYFKKSIRDSRKIGYKRGEALAREFLGEIYYSEGYYDRALRYLKNSLKLAKEIAPEGDIAVEVYRRLGDTYLSTGNLKRAQESLSRALALAQKLEDRYELGTILRANAILNFRKDDIESSRAYFKEAITTLILLKEKKELAGTYLAAANCFYEWTKKKKKKTSSSVLSGEELLNEAKNYLIEAVNLYSSLGFNDDIGRCKRLLKKIENKGTRKSDTKEFRTIKFDPTNLYDGEIVAASYSMISALEKAKLLAESDMPILISGETGTGKELLARYIHKISSRATRPFVAINCAAIPHPIFESELFGHVKGAFTGAYRDKAGLIEKANGGTIFLDEVFELGTEEQAKLLRVLQEGTVRRVGDTKERKIDIRLISATNNNIDSYLNDGRLRRDFYYRICAEAIEIEPLRKRKDDILPLLAYYLHKLNGSERIEQAAVDKLLKYLWPGNVRELIGIAKMLAILSKDKGGILKENLPQRIRDFADSEKAIITNRSKLHFKFDSFNEPQINELISRTLEEYKGNRSEAARKLGISRTTLYRWMKKLST